MTAHLLHHLLEAAADTHPERPAVVDRGTVVSYGSLEERANRLAHLLLELGVRRGDRVGLLLGKSPDALVAIYGTSKAGAGYVPLDPQAPPSRLAAIARNAGIRCLLVAAETAGHVESLARLGARVEHAIVLDTTRRAHRSGDVPLLTGAALDGRPGSRPRVPGVDLDLAYILYTSGSTGDPKGVTLSHRNALTFVDWAAERFGLTAADRLSSHAPLHFDLSIFDLFAAARAAAGVVLVPPEISVFPRAVAAFIAEHRITTWYSVPSILSMLTLRGGLRPGDLPCLRTILFAGEVFPVGYLRRLMRQLPHVALYNLYGPTETNVCTYYPVPYLPDDRVTPIPIGRAIANVDVFAVDDGGTPVDPGEVGELLVRGSSVMRGYWADPERSRAALTPDPVFPAMGEPVYRTGDLVREDGDGNLEFLGRRDSQVKCRGYRIELGDVEAAIYADPSVVECAVTAVPDPLVTNRLKAYVVLRDGGTTRQVLVTCAGRVPPYMVPELVEERDQLPRTSTGKVDRRALAANEMAR